MPPAPVSVRRSRAELVVGSALVLATGVLAIVGVLVWLVTFLEAAYPCGETYHEHPACRLAHPGAVGAASLLLTAVPLLCTLAGPLVGALTFARRRHAIPATAVAFGIALVAFAAGRQLLLATLHEVVPW